jgi:hypothetical protein
MKRHNSPFAPSAAQLYAECEKIIERNARLNPAPRLAAPRREEYSAEHRASMIERFNKLMADMRAGKIVQKPGLPLADLANWEKVINGVSNRYVMRVDADGRPLKIPYGYPGAGQPVEYGYLTPREAAIVKAKRMGLPLSEAAE